MKYIIPLPKFSPTGPAQLLKVLLGTGPPKSIHSTKINIKSTFFLTFALQFFDRPSIRLIKTMESASLCLHFLAYRLCF